MNLTFAKPTVLGILAVVPVFVCAHNDPPDPKQFPETVKVISETKQTVDKGSTVTTRSVQPTILNPTPRTKSVVKPSIQSYYQVVVEIGETRYTVNGKAGAPGVPFGTFKGRITNQYLDIYIVDQNGLYVLGFEIVGAEKIESPSPDGATSSGDVVDEQKKASPQNDPIAKPLTDETGQWFLESYDEKTGYVFRKDGIRYTTHCKVSYLHDAVNVLPAASESECSAVLPYFHKSLPLEQGPRGPDLQILRFTETREAATKGWHCEFVIAKAN
jgi:hypothetical protein